MTMDDLDYKIIVLLAECRMNVMEVSRRVYMHRNTVVYRLRKIRKITGKDPLNFYDLHDLVQKVVKSDD
jgi:carbohydrate diacid regulator